MNDRVIVHSRYGIKLRYEFGSEELVYTWSDLTGRHRCSAPYENIEVGHPSHLAINNWLFAIGLFLALITLIVGTLVPILVFQLPPFLIIIPGTVLPVAFVMIRLSVPFSLHLVLLPVSIDAFGGQAPPVWIWDDEKGQEVMDELLPRWRERIRSLYAFVDPENDAEREAAKFGWLRQNDLIDEAEYLAALGEIEVHCSVFGAERPLH